MLYKSLLTRLAAVAAATLALVACAAAPRQIASYPANPGRAPVPIAREPAEPYPSEVIVYNADLELGVGDVDAAADRAWNMASGYGGYLQSSQSWTQDGHRYATLVLAVPPSRFDDLRRGLMDLGTLVGELITPDTSSGDEWARSGRLAHIRLQLRPAPSLPFPSFTPALPNGWSPARTFEHAFNVAASIFQVIADIMIWVVVVAGPFAVVGLVVWIAVRQIRRKPG